jgi:hypothetical protein
MVANPAHVGSALCPLWTPDNVTFDTLPQSLQETLIEFVDPAYRRLVLETSDPLAKAAGLSFVHLLWLELVSQHELGRAMAGLSAGRQGTVAQHDHMSRHVRLVVAKDGISKIILRARRIQTEAALLGSRQKDT